MALPAIAAAAARSLPKVARGAGKILRRGKRLPLPGTKGEEKEKTRLLSPKGIFLLSIGLILDFLSIICVILIVAFGVGFLLAKIVWIAGTIIFAVLGFFDGKGKNPLMRFFKKQWKKLAVKAVPGIGDALPIWTLTAISMV